jgi:hypothetical protein
VSALTCRILLKARLDRCDQMIVQSEPTCSGQAIASRLPANRMLSYAPKLPPYELSDTRTGIQFCREMNVGAKAALDELLTGGAAQRRLRRWWRKLSKTAEAAGGASDDPTTHAALKSCRLAETSRVSFR